jgi:hypothetical protein
MVHLARGERAIDNERLCRMARVIEDALELGDVSPTRIV